MKISYRRDDAGSGSFEAFGLEQGPIKGLWEKAAFGGAVVEVDNGEIQEVIETTHIDILCVDGWETLVVWVNDWGIPGEIGIMMTCRFGDYGTVSIMGELGNPEESWSYYLNGTHPEMFPSEIEQAKARMREMMSILYRVPA